ncbi:universal stress protein [Polymorphobacter megasporae]|uniref:universal stress protein n=1 Tax=Glacieibacterium megasporae TaxID=2835787 RepID=UPI001C1E77EC|nr:universal stress protein [Polymorphobacter megasporae]UAJ12776.1 hypothetical protein KTC28_19735 [Polymorphobacter megasporae]
MTIVEIASAAKLSAAKLRLEDLVGWLRHQLITATAAPVLVIGDDATQLAQFIAEAKADPTVAGAYGYSRMRQWALGGVTRDLLLAPQQCALAVAPTNCASEIKLL